jgi:hypothetical protein
MALGLGLAQEHPSPTALRQQSRLPFNLYGRSVGSVASVQLPLPQEASDAGAPAQVLTQPPKYPVARVGERPLRPPATPG